MSSKSRSRAHSRSRSKTSSNTLIRVKDHISTKRNAGTEGKLGKLKGKTSNNMYILEIDGKYHNFFAKDLDLDNMSVKGKNRAYVHTMSPTSIRAKQHAERILEGLNSNDYFYMDKVIHHINKKRKSKKVKGSRNSLKASCKDDEEFSVKTGRCIKKCRSGQVRNVVTNRCTKKMSRSRHSKRSNRSNRSNKGGILISEEVLLDDVPERSEKLSKFSNSKMSKIFSKLSSEPRSSHRSTASSLGIHNLYPSQHTHSRHTPFQRTPRHGLKPHYTPPTKHSIRTVSPGELISVGPSKWGHSGLSHSISYEEPYNEDIYDSYETDVFI